MTDHGHLTHPDDEVPGPGDAGGPGASPGPEVVDFDLLGDLTAPTGAGVVDVADLAGPDRVDEPGGVDGFGGAEVLAASSVDVAELDDLPADEAPPVEVADPTSLGGRGAPRPGRVRRGDRRPAIEDDAPASDRSAEAEPARRRSSFGDGGSRSFGGRGRGGGGGRKSRAPREWGIQLDAEVEEPQPRAVADGAAGVVDEGPSVPADRRPPGRGRGGFGGRSRRAEGEPPRAYDDPERAAKDICLTALTGTARSRKQLADLLAEREIPDDVATAVLDRFGEVGLVDDAAFAAAWVRSRQTGRGLSRRALAHELRAKGVDAEVASVALEAVDPQDEWDTARALVARKVPGMRRLDSATATRRLTAMLGRKGYGAGLAAWVVREALEADGKAEDTAAEADDAAPDLPGPEPAVRRGLWSGRPLDEPDAAPAAEVGEGMTAEGWARTRRPGRGLR